jgi:hypothetical protein
MRAGGFRTQSGPQCGLPPPPNNMRLPMSALVELDRPRGTRGGGIALGEAEQAYIARTSGREAYKRAMETCQATKAWWTAEGAGQ